MAELFTAISVALVVVWGVYLSLEFFETHAALRDAPKKPVGGVESAVGKSAVVVDDFSTGSKPHSVGRVQFDGETWNAVFVGESSKLPRAGERVTIVAIDAANLKVKVQ